MNIDTYGLNLGEGAFKENNQLKGVYFSQTSDQNVKDTTIGDECFASCTSLTRIELLNDNHTNTNIYPVNVVSIGNKAFKTGSSELTIKGIMKKGYVPYEYACQDDELHTHSYNSSMDSYITYISGNPHNLVARYNGDLGGMELKYYPTIETVINKDHRNENGEGDITVGDLIARQAADAASITYVEKDIIKYATEELNIPEGIEFIDHARSDPARSTVRGTYPLFKGLTEGSTDTGRCLGPVSITLGKYEGEQATENINSVHKIPRGAFENSRRPKTITFVDNITELGSISGNDLNKRVFWDDPDIITKNNPLLYGTEDEKKAPSIENVLFWGDENIQTRSNASISDPYYWCSNYIIYSDNGEKVTLEEVLPAREQIIKAENDPNLKEVDEISPYAFANCDRVNVVDLSECTDLSLIPAYCFYDCNGLRTVSFPTSVNTIKEEAFGNDYGLADVYLPGKEISIADSAFFVEKPTLKEAPTMLHSYTDSAVERYVKYINDKNRSNPTSWPAKIAFEDTMTYTYTVKFIDHDRKLLGKVEVISGGYVSPRDYPTVPGWEGHTFVGWQGYSENDYTPKDVLEPITENMIFEAQYTSETSSSSSTDTSSSSTGTSSSSSTNKKSTTSSSGGNNSSTNKSSSSSSSSSSSGSSLVSTTIMSSTVPNPVVLTSGIGSIGNLNAQNPGAGGGNAAQKTNTGGSSGNGGNNGNGKTNVVSTTPGISDIGKMSATVNGSSDNYVIKITKTQEADELAQKALLGEFGSLDAIRYLPMDISLYDNTGTNKISPIPEGVTISITMPIPDDLQIYGGNAKAACTEGGVLDKIQPRFTVINGVACMNFTVTHLSPYVVYVDTANLTAEGIQDATPKTGDPIHPKWFLAIGLAAASVFLFLKREKGEAVKVTA